MKKIATQKFLAAAAIVAIVMVMPALALANNTGVKSNVINPTGSNFALLGPLLVCTGVPGASGSAINATCTNVYDFVAQIANIIYYLIAVVLWIIAPILIAVGGLMIMLGGASPEMVGRGKKTITGAVWGVVIVLCAWLIVFTFLSAFGGLNKYVGGFNGGG